MSAQPNAHYVTLLARDEVSRQFKVMGQSATSAATQINTSFKGANAELARTDATTARTTASFKDFEQTAIRTGAALGAAVGVLSQLGQAADDQERQVRGIEAAYGDAADEVLRFADAIQGSTRFSNEQVREAATLASTLQRNYGLTTEQIEELIARSADLAALHGITLPDAVQRTQSAIRGEAESAEALGLTLNDNVVAAEAAARGIDGWTTSLSESEKAQFRFTLLLEQSNFATGQAGEAAQTAAGRAAQLGNAVQDVAVDVGQLLGPVAGATAGLADLALVLPVATAGAGKLVAGLAQGPAVFGRFATGAAGIVSAINPLTLGAGVALGAVGLLTKGILDYREAADAAADPTDTLTDAIIRLGQGAEGAEVALLTSRVVSFWEESSEAARQAETDFLAAVDALTAQPTLGLGATEAMAEAIVEQTQALEEQRNAAEAAAITAQGLRDIEADLLAVFQQQGPELRNDLALLDEAFRSYQEGTYSGAQLVEVINNIAENDQAAAQAIANIGNEAAIAAPIMDDLTRSVTGAYGAINQGVDTEALRQFREDAKLAREEAERFFETQRAIAASQSNALAGGSEAIGLFRTPSERAADAADLEAASKARATERAEEHARAVEDEARALDEQARASLETADALIGSQDDVARAAAQSAQAQADAAREVGEIERQRIQETAALSREYAQESKAGARERVEFERDAQREIIDLERERRDVVVATEEELRELAEQRGELQLEASRAVAEAEQDWLQTSRENVREQAQLKSELARTTAEAAREWQELNRQNLAAQQAIKAELQDTLQEQNIDIRRTRQDIDRERQRIKEDLAIALSDPNLTPEQRFQLELDAQRRLEDLKREEKRAEQDFARERREARRTAREEEKQLEEERKAAAQEYHREVQGLESETNQRIQDLERERQAAAAAFADQRAEAERDAASRLAEIAEQERETLEEQARRFAEIEREKELAARNTARERGTLERQLANEAEQHAREVAQVERDAAREVAAVRSDLLAQETDEQSKLQELVDAGLLSQEQANRIHAEAVRQQTEARDLEDEKLAIAGLQLLRQGDLVAGDRERIRLAEELNAVAEPADPGDGQPRQGRIRRDVQVAVEVDVAAIDRQITVALAGIEDRAELTIDTTPFTLALANAQRDADAFAAQAFTTELLADVGSGDSHVGGGAGPLLDVLVQAKNILDLYEQGGEEGGAGWTTTLLADNSAVITAIEEIEIGLDLISEIETEIAVNADMSAFRRAIREIDGDTVATVFVDVQETGVESVGGESSGRSATAQGRGALSATSIGSFGGAPAAPSRGNPPSVINTYGPVNVYPQSPDLHREIARSVATKNR